MKDVRIEDYVGDVLFVDDDFIEFFFIRNLSYSYCSFMVWVESGRWFVLVMECEVFGVEIVRSGYGCVVCVGVICIGGKYIVC